MRTASPTTKASRSAAILGRTVDRALAPGDLTPAGYRLLAYLTAGTSAANVLAEKLAVSRPTVTAATDWLQSHGLVIRTPNAEDRRRVAITITPAGEVALAEADAQVAKRLAEVLAFVPEDDAGRIIAALEQLYDALNAHRAHRHDRFVRQRPAE